MFAQWLKKLPKTFNKDSYMRHFVRGMVFAVLLLGATAPAQISDKRNFTNTCSNCHGLDGRGKTEYGLRNKVPDFRSQRVQSMSDAKIADTIARGTDHRVYPHSFVIRHILTDEEVHSIVQEIRAMAK